MQKTDLQIGQLVSGFKVEAITPLAEIRLQAIRFTHIKTGCEVLHLYNDDKENVFSFNFRTPPFDSSGISHILEHSVLCGSKNYPVKDPFVILLKGSMQSFLNAMTSNMRKLEEQQLQVVVRH